MVETMVVVEWGDELGEGYRRRITEVYVRAFAEETPARGHGCRGRRGTTLGNGVGRPAPAPARAF